MGKESRKRTWNIVKRALLTVLTTLAMAFVLAFGTTDNKVFQNYPLGSSILYALLFILCACGYIFFIEKITDNEINAGNYPDIRSLAVGSIVGANIIGALFAVTIIENKWASSGIVSIPLFVFSLLTYFSLVFKWKNSIFLIRSWLLTLIIGSIYLMVLRMSEYELQTWSALWKIVLVVVGVCLIIALCARGFIITFGENAKKVFSKEDRRTKWYDIFLVLFLVCATIICYRTNWESVLFPN